MDLLFSFGRVLFVSSWEEVEGQSKQPWFGWSAISVQEIKKARQNVHFSCAELQIEKKNSSKNKKKFQKKSGLRNTHTTWRYYIKLIDISHAFGYSSQAHRHQRVLLSRLEYISRVHVEQ